MWRAILPILLIINCYSQPAEKNLASMLKVLHDTGDSEAIAYLNKLVDEVRSKNGSTINSMPNGTLHLVNKTQEMQTQNGTTSLRAVLQKNIEIIKNQNSTGNNVTTITTDFITRSEFALNNTEHPTIHTGMPLNNTDGMSSDTKANNKVIIHVPIYIDLKRILDKVQTEKKDLDKKAETNVNYTANNKPESDEILISKEVDKFIEMYNNAIDNLKEIQESKEVDNYRDEIIDPTNYKVRVFALVPEISKDKNSYEYIAMHGQEKPDENFSSNSFYKPMWQKGINFVDGKNDYPHQRNEIPNSHTRLKKNRNKHLKSNSYDTYDALSDEKVAQLIRKILTLSKRQHQGSPQTN